MATSQPETLYSKEKTIATIASFYKFIAGVHSEESGASGLKFPPPTGWPEITRELFPYFTETAFDLVRHLPYFHDDETFFIMPDTNAMDYTSGLLLRGLQKELMRSKEEKALDQTDQTQPMSPHFVQLGKRGQYGLAIYLDTDHGVVIEHGEESRCSHVDNGDLECYAEYEQSKGNFKRDLDEIDPYGDDAWMISPAYRMEEYFENCKETYRSMKWMPALAWDAECGKCIEVGSGDSEEEDKMQQIMKDAGWPGDGEGGGWDKARAEREMAKAFSEEIEDE